MGRGIKHSFHHLAWLVADRRSGQENARYRAHWLRAPLECCVSGSVITGDFQVIHSSGRGANVNPGDLDPGVCSFAHRLLG